MVEPLATIFVAVCLLVVGAGIAYAATREPMPLWLKERRGLSRITYDISDEAARTIGLIVGVFVAMFGLAALLLGLALLAGV